MDEINNDQAKWKTLQRFDGGLTNFDFSVDPGVENALRSGQYYCTYTARDFFGYVWFDGKFYCEVWQYRCPVGQLAAESLEKLMHFISERYGYD